MKQILLIREDDNGPTHAVQPGTTKDGKLEYVGFEHDDTVFIDMLLETAASFCKYMGVSNVDAEAKFKAAFSVPTIGTSQTQLQEFIKGSETITCECELQLPACAGNCEYRRIK